MLTSLWLRVQTLGSSKHTNDSLSSLLHFSREVWQISHFLSFYKGRDQYQRATLVAQLIKNLPAMQKTPVQFPGWEDALEQDRLPTPVFMAFPGGSYGTESACNAGDLGSVPGLGRSPGGGHGNLLQYSCLENPHGQRSLAGYSPWVHKESDMTE